MGWIADLVSGARNLAAGRGSAPVAPCAVGAASFANVTEPGGGPYVQPDRTTCGSACLVMARMLADASYAAWMQAGTETDRRSPERRFADEALATHRRTNRWRDTAGAAQLAWPLALGTTPWALARELGATGGTAPAGTSYAVRAVAPRDRDTSFAAIADEVARGQAVPLFVGSRLLPRHVVLVVGGDERCLTAYDPAAGRRVGLPRDDFARGTLGESGWTDPWFSVLAD